MPIGSILRFKTPLLLLNLYTKSFKWCKTFSVIHLTIRFIVFYLRIFSRNLLHETLGTFSILSDGPPQSFLKCLHQYKLDLEFPPISQKVSFPFRKSYIPYYVHIFSYFVIIEFVIQVSYHCKVHRLRDLWISFQSVLSIQTLAQVNTEDTELGTRTSGSFPKGGLFTVQSN